MNLKIGDILICHKQRLKKRRGLIGQIIKISEFVEDRACPVMAQAYLPSQGYHGGAYSYDYLDKHYRPVNSLELMHYGDIIEKL